jgi:hypothetical protein
MRPILPLRPLALSACALLAACAPSVDKVEPDDDAGADALDAVVASPITGTQVISLGYLGPDAGYGVRLLEAIVASYRLAIGELERNALAERLGVCVGLALCARLALRLRGRECVASDGQRRAGLEGDRFLERRDGFVALAQVEEHDAFVAIDDRVVRHAGRDRPGALQLFQRALA